MKRKLLALLLAALMCTSFLIACSSKDDSSQISEQLTTSRKEPSESDDNKENYYPIFGEKNTDSLFDGEDNDPILDTGDTTQASGTDNKPMDNVPAKPDEDILKIDDYVARLAAEHDLGGATFTYIGGGGQTAEYDEETGNIENDALYKRQRELEETLGIVWESVVASYDESSNNTSHAVVDYVKQSVMADIKDYDLVYGTLVVTILPIFNDNCLEGVSEFRVTDFSNEWWPATLEETLSIGDELYFLTGPIMTSYYKDASCILFNKNVAELYGIEAPFENVLDGTWTFDKMFELASAIPPNTNGTGTYRYGSPDGLSILFANGMTITKFDDAGIPYVGSSLPAELYDLAGKFSVIMGDESQTAITKHSGSTYENTQDKYGYESFSWMFAEDGFLFYFAPTGEVPFLREIDAEFSILPMPKASADQSQYYSYANNWDARYCAVPKSTRDLKTTDVVLEAMAALSLKYIRPAYYYDKLLKGRSFFDEDSKEMLNIIFESKIYDIVDIYALGDASQSGALVKGIERAIEYDDSSIASSYTIYARMANKQIEKIMTNINR